MFRGDHGPGYVSIHKPLVDLPHQGAAQSSSLHVFVAGCFSVSNQSNAEFQKVDNVPEHGKDAKNRTEFNKDIVVAVSVHL